MLPFTDLHCGFVFQWWVGNCSTITINGLCIANHQIMQPLSRALLKTNDKFSCYHMRCFVQLWSVPIYVIDPTPSLVSIKPSGKRFNNSKPSINEFCLNAGWRLEYGLYYLQSWATLLQLKDCNLSQTKDILDLTNHMTTTLPVFPPIALFSLSLFELILDAEFLTSKTLFN